MIFGKSSGETTIGTVANDRTGHRTASVTDLKTSLSLSRFFNTGMNKNFRDATFSGKLNDQWYGE